MAEKLYTFPRLVEKGFTISVPVLDAAAWEQRVKADPTIPRSLTQLRKLARTIFQTKGRPQILPLLPEGISRGVLSRRFEECGEVLRSRFITALANPFLTPEQREVIERDLDADLPTFDNSIETDHFILRWTNSSAHASDNIADSAIVTETGTFLESAWTQYNSVFGRPPYLTPGTSKIEVVFYDISGFGATTPGGPIELDAPNWVAQPGIRRPTSAHELFHRLQYAYGYRTTWAPSGTYQWFSEGTASWAEVFVWQRVSAAYKVTNLFANPDLNLYNASYGALPFWIFFQTRQQDFPGDNPMISFLQKYEATGNQSTAMAEVIDEDWPANNVYGQLDTFFALFSRDRKLGSWRITPSGPTPYPTIKDPTGADIEPVLMMTSAALGSGDAYTNTGSVSQLGSDYYAFTLEPDTAGQIFAITVTVPSGGNYSYYLIWEKDGVWKRASFPFAVTVDFSLSETIDLALANTVILIISGRGTGGLYTLNVSVS
jgi:hypothetical protein